MDNKSAELKLLLDYLDKFSGECGIRFRAVKRFFRDCEYVKEFNGSR